MAEAEGAKVHAVLAMSSSIASGAGTYPLLGGTPLAGPMTADLARYAIATSVTLVVGPLMGYRPSGGAPGVAAGMVPAVRSGWSIAGIFLWIRTRSKSAVQGMCKMIMFSLASPCGMRCGRRGLRSTRRSLILSAGLTSAATNEDWLVKMP